MTCRELIEFLMEYTDGHLAPEVRAEFDRHLRTCASCAAYLETYRKTIDLARGSLCVEADGTLPASVPDELVEAILKARGRRTAGEAGLSRDDHPHPAK